MISKRTSVFLICLFSVWNVLHAESNDSLIVGGVPIQIEIDLAVDSLGEESPVVLPKAAKSQPAKFQAQFALGSQHLQSGTVASRIKRSMRPSAGFSLAWIPAMNRSAVIRPEVRLTFQHFTALGFDTAQLHDSLSAFESIVAGGLDQILLFQYELGVETDTVPIDLSRSVVQSIGLDVGGRGLLMPNSKRPFFVRGGVRVVWNKAGPLDRAVELGQGKVWRPEEGGLQMGFWAGVQRGLGRIARQGASRRSLKGLYWGAEAQVHGAGLALQRWSADLVLGYAFR